MAYAVRDDALARAGRFAGLFQVVGKRPNEADLDGMLDDVAAIIDAEIRSRGYDPTTLTAEVEAALKDVNAWAALVRLLPAAAPGDDDVSALVDRGNEALKASGFPGLAAGVDVFSALEVLEAGRGGGGAGTSAGSLWDELQQPSEERDADEIGEDAAPLWQRGQTL